MDFKDKSGVTPDTRAFKVTIIATHMRDHDTMKAPRPSLATQRRPAHAAHSPCSLEHESMIDGPFTLAVVLVIVNSAFDDGSAERASSAAILPITANAALAPLQAG